MLSRSKTSLLLSAALLLSTGFASAEETTLFESSEKQTALIELFTSEGCSSCPPAEAWLSGLKSESGLWKEFVPVAFHVDYWDRQGWKDRFANALFTQRQRAYASVWGSGSVYTPAFAVNGKEWKGKSGLPSGNGARVGVLKISRAEGNRLAFTFAPTAGSDSQWDLHLALLGNEIASKIKGGENGGRVLQHDFVALKYERLPMKNAEGIARVEANQPQGAEGTRTALAAWVTRHDENTPVQATGGWLR